jgi:hypothetical protein
MDVTRSAPFNLPPLDSADEYLVVLVNARRFDRLLRKDEFLDEGVSGIFGLAGAEAELLSLSFQAGKFTPSQVAAWLVERRFTTPLDVSIVRRSSPPLT